MDEKCEARLVARFSEADDVREVFVGGDGAGGLSIREEVSGPSARLVYDEDRHVSRISLGEAALQRLAEERRWEGDVRGCVEEWLTAKDHALIDLMDIRDAWKGFRPAVPALRLVILSAHKKGAPEGAPSYAWCAV